MFVTSSTQFSTVVLIATCNREQLLVQRALASVSQQTRPPDHIVVVNDGLAFSHGTARCLTVFGERLTLIQTDNSGSGAACAWNRGLGWLWERGYRGFVALLDDDDTWDADHLDCNIAAAQCQDGNLVVSGLRLSRDGIIYPRPLIRSLVDRDYLVGNPGWQGSNTFVSLPLIRQAGGFREGLMSLNDRDLAIRLLRLPDTHPILVSRWTATWYADTPGALSTRGGPAKLAGLRQFWNLYGAEMTPVELRAFFARSENLFGFTESQIRDPIASGELLSTASR